MKIKELLNKIEFTHIAIFIIIAIILFFVYYQYNSSVPKEEEIKNIEQTEQLDQENLSIQDITKKKKVITCTINEEEFNEEEYYNYVIGKGKGRIINCSILIKAKENYYKIKTLQRGKTEDGKIILEGIVRNNYLFENCEILLYNNENKKVYNFLGGSSETNI